MAGTVEARLLRRRLAQLEARVAEWWPEGAAARQLPDVALPPKVVWCAAKCCGAAGEATPSLAAAVGALAAAFVAHDAVRGDGPAAWRHVGWSPNKAAILVGDYLMAQAFGLLADLGEDRWTLQLAEVVQARSEARLRELVAPEKLPPAELLALARAKGSLLAFCARAGAESAAAPAETAALLSRFGEQVGTALALNGAPVPHRLRTDAAAALAPLPDGPAKEWLLDLATGEPR